MIDLLIALIDWSIDPHSPHVFLSPISAVIRISFYRTVHNVYCHTVVLL